MKSTYELLIERVMKQTELTEDEKQSVINDIDPATCECKKTVYSFPRIDKGYTLIYRINYPRLGNFHINQRRPLTKLTEAHYIDKVAVDDMDAQDKNRREMLRKSIDSHDELTDEEKEYLKTQICENAIPPVKSISLRRVAEKKKIKVWIGKYSISPVILDHEYTVLHNKNFVDKTSLKEALNDKILNDKISYAEAARVFDKYDDESNSMLETTFEFYDNTGFKIKSIKITPSTNVDKLILVKETPSPYTEETMNLIRHMYFVEKMESRDIWKKLGLSKRQFYVALSIIRNE